MRFVPVCLGVCCLAALAVWAFRAGARAGEKEVRGAAEEWRRIGEDAKRHRLALARAKDELGSAKTLKEKVWELAEQGGDRQARLQEAQERVLQWGKEYAGDEVDDQDHEAYWAREGDSPQMRRAMEEWRTRFDLGELNLEEVAVLRRKLEEQEQAERTKRADAADTHEKRPQE